MHATELDSFVGKFHQLWKAGFTAHLDLDTHAGNAWIGLRVQLGPAPPGRSHHPTRMSLLVATEDHTIGGVWKNAEQHALRHHHHQYLLQKLGMDSRSLKI